MTTKRKQSETVDVESQPRRQRRRERSSSEPLSSDTNSAEKQQLLRRLFVKSRPGDVDQRRNSFDDYQRMREESGLVDENDDPLLDSVPVELDPEQLGFLVCAQETLRFLHVRGISIGNPVFTTLRSRFIAGIDEMAAA